MPDDRHHRPPASPPPSAPPAALRPLGIAVYVCVLLFVAVAGVKTGRDLSTVEARKTELQQDIAATNAEIERLEAKIHRIDEDPMELERLAREELKMVYPGDIVVVLPPPPGDSDSEPPDPETP